MLGKTYSCKKAIAIMTILLFLTLSTQSVICSCDNKRFGGYITNIRGGIGVTVTINNEIVSHPSNNVSLNWTLVIEGDFVTFGTASGSAPPHSTIKARTPYFPPSFGFGIVDITIEVSKFGQILSTEKCSGFMVGPFVFSVLC